MKKIPLHTLSILVAAALLVVVVPYVHAQDEDGGSNDSANVDYNNYGDSGGNPGAVDSGIPTAASEVDYNNYGDSGGTTIFQSQPINTNFTEPDNTQVDFPPQEEISYPPQEPSVDASSNAWFSNPDFASDGSASYYPQQTADYPQEEITYPPEPTPIYVPPDATPVVNGQYQEDQNKAAGGSNGANGYYQEDQSEASGGRNGANGYYQEDQNSAAGGPYANNTGGSDQRYYQEDQNSAAGAPLPGTQYKVDPSTYVGCAQGDCGPGDGVGHSEPMPPSKDGTTNKDGDKFVPAPSSDNKTDNAGDIRTAGDRDLNGYGPSSPSEQQAPSTVAKAATTIAAGLDTLFGRDVVANDSKPASSNAGNGGGNITYVNLTQDGTGLLSLPAGQTPPPGYTRVYTTSDGGITTDSKLAASTDPRTAGDRDLNGYNGNGNAGAAPKYNSIGELIDNLPNKGVTNTSNNSSAGTAVEPSKALVSQAYLFGGTGGAATVVDAYKPILEAQYKEIAVASPSAKLPPFSSLSGWQLAGLKDTIENHNGDTAAVAAVLNGATNTTVSPSAASSGGQIPNTVPGAPAYSDIKYVPPSTPTYQGPTGTGEVTDRGPSAPKPASPSSKPAGPVWTGEGDTKQPTSPTGPVGSGGIGEQDVGKTGNLGTPPVSGKPVGSGGIGEQDVGRGTNTPPATTPATFTPPPSSFSQRLIKVGACFISFMCDY